MALHYKFLMSGEYTDIADYQSIHCENFIDTKTTLCKIELQSNAVVSSIATTFEKITCANCLEIIKRCKEVKTSEISYRAHYVKAPYECFKLNWELQKGRTKILDLAEYKALIVMSYGLRLIHKKTSQIVEIWHQSWIEDAIKDKDYQTRYLNFYYFNDHSIYDYAKENKILILPGEDWKIVLKQGRKK